MKSPTIVLESLPEYGIMGLGTRVFFFVYKDFVGHCHTIP
jgi:hypothetical protein